MVFFLRRGYTKFSILEEGRKEGVLSILSHRDGVAGVVACYRCATIGMVLERIGIYNI